MPVLEKVNIVKRRLIFLFKVLIHVTSVRWKKITWKPIPNPKNKKNEKIFVTGVYGSGKTFFAKKYAKEQNVPYISFDNQFVYHKKENQSQFILNNLPPSFMMDAIPIDEKGTWSDFFEYAAINNPLVIYVYCPNEQEWVRRVFEKAKKREVLAKKGIRNILKNFRGYVRAKVSWWKFMIERSVQFERKEVLRYLSEYRNSFYFTLPGMKRFENILFYDSFRNEFTTEGEMLNRIQYDAFRLKTRLNELEGQYDVGYQDIEVIGFVGYSNSFKTWNHIKDLVDWKGARVVDLGCFHGYFCFKVEECGGIVSGLDRSSTALETARMINQVRGGHVVFKEWIGGDDIPECDVIMCLNVLHHYGDATLQEKALSKMKCKKAVFEINESQRPLIEKYFEGIKEFPSHRKHRIILLANSLECSGRENSSVSEMRIHQT
ncbi:MAG TPA: hypothetical protein VGB26_02655 [Nitrospiria bacterium]